MAEEPMPGLLVSALAALDQEERSRAERLWQRLDDASRRELRSLTSSDQARRVALMLAMPRSEKGRVSVRSMRRSP